MKKEYDLRKEPTRYIRNPEKHIIGSQNNMRTGKHRILAYFNGYEKGERKSDHAGSLGMGCK